MTTIPAVVLRPPNQDVVKQFSAGHRPLIRDEGHFTTITTNLGITTEATVHIADYRAEVGFAVFTRGPGTAPEIRSRILVWSANPPRSLAAASAHPSSPKLIPMSRAVRIESQSGGTVFCRRVT